MNRQNFVSNIFKVFRKYSGLCFDIATLELYHQISSIMESFNKFTKKNGKKWQFGF